MLLARALLLSLLLWAPSAKAKTKIFVVRHAEKLPDPGDGDPKLSPAGLARAQTLAEVLRDVELSAIYSTKYKRNTMTAAPVAKLKKKKTIIVEAKAVEVMAKTLKRKHKNEQVLVVGHSNTVPELLYALGVRPKRTLDHWMYDDLFVVTLDGKKVELIHLHYGSRSLSTR